MTLEVQEMQDSHRVVIRFIDARYLIEALINDVVLES